MDAVHPADGAAARTGRAFVAGRANVVEIVAARALVQVAAVGRGVAQLRARPGQDRGGEQRVVLDDQGVPGRVGVAHQRAQAQPAVGQALDRGEREAVDVHNGGGPLGALLHQVH